MNTKNMLYVIYSITLAIGITFILGSLFVNSAVPDLARIAAESFAQKENAEILLPLISGLIAGGNMIVVPVNFVIATLLFGFFLTYLSVSSIIAIHSGQKTTIIFTRAYWSHFNASIKYQPVKKS